MCEPDPDDHSRTIIHIDMDCFYAQVEMNKKPSLRDAPMGVYQKRFVVTSNYKARTFGVKKCMLIREAKELCPELVLVNGEDLYDYRQASYKVTNLCHTYTKLVERLGLDENFLDVSMLVDERFTKGGDVKVVGRVFGGAGAKCACGCTLRLTIGSVIASEIRAAIKTEFNLTTCAGISHNKLLAKLAGGCHKPDQQTTVFPNSALELMLSLECPSKITGVGRVLSEQLPQIGVKSIGDLQNVDLKKLEGLIGAERAKTIRNNSWGVDPTPVKTTGKPQTISLEDACKTISIEKEVRLKLEQLLSRLLILVKEDGRIPKTIKLTVRKWDMANKVSHRESRQCNINPSSFTESRPNEAKLIATIMHLFNRIVDATKPYHITLIGLSFTKFQEPSRTSIVSFLRKDLEVQSITSIRNENRDDEAKALPRPSTSSVEFSVESPTPSPKKLKLSLLGKKRCFEDVYEDCESPSKLNVEDLCLETVSCPPDVDKEVFKELPTQVQKELWQDHKRRTKELTFCSSQVKKAKANTLLNYFIRN